jgi:hypothetical protein
MAETEALLLAALPDDAHLIVESVPDAAVVYGDPAQLQQVVINLCNNAYQALDGIGTITVVIDLHILPRLVTLGADLLAESGICEVVKTPLASAQLACALPRWLRRDGRLGSMTKRRVSV